MSRDPIRAATQFFGGRICLDFANTVDWRTSDDPIELIPDYTTLLTWSAGRKTLLPAALGKLRARSEEAACGEAIARAHDLRARLWAAFDALMSGRSLELEPFNELLRSMPSQPELAAEGHGYVYNLRGECLDEPIWPVLWSLTAVLASHDAGRIGRCHAQGCGWFFVDESPNHTRLWCLR